MHEGSVARVKMFLKNVKANVEDDGLLIIFGNVLNINDLKDIVKFVEEVAEKEKDTPDGVYAQDMLEDMS